MRAPLEESADLKKGAEAATAGNMNLWIEAECLELVGNWTVQEDTNASDGKFLLPPGETSHNTVPEEPGDVLQFFFTVPEAGEYFIYGRVLSTFDKDDSFWIRVNDDAWLNWNKINADPYSGTYRWEQVGNWSSGNQPTPVSFNLEAGQHRLSISWREPNVRLDKLLITNQQELPRDEGSIANYLCEPACPEAGTPCDDGNPDTVNDVEDGNCNCAGEPAPQCPEAGTPCDDGNPDTVNDVEDGNCNCAGEPAPQCPEAGTPCDDGNPDTVNDVEDGNCNCAGQSDTPASFQISGELKKWHKVTITFNGPLTSETDEVNPFTDYRLNVAFLNGGRTFVVPGYYAADGDAANSEASGGNKWRVHFTPDATGSWSFNVSFRQGENIAVSDDPAAGTAVSFDSAAGSFEVGPTDKTGRDNRAKGRLQYVNQHYLRYAETGEYFIKIGADSPENFLSYDDFDNTPDYGGRRKSWAPHLADWRTGDPTWRNGRGKGIIGAVNYLASEGQNAFSFLTLNINGDDDNVFPYISDDRRDRLRMDCSKLDQWEILFEHADRQGMYLHFKTQETENDQLLDGGDLGTERKLYYRELIARFAHHLALNWNIGEENSNTTAQQIDFAEYFYQHDPYKNHIVLHTYPGKHEEVYTPLLGQASKYTGPSLQNSWGNSHRVTQIWLEASAQAGKPWVVAHDEQNTARIGVPHDAYTGSPAQSDIRNGVLWGNLMAGGAGVEYYFGYDLPHSDLTCQDFRSRDRMWDYNRYAHQFFTNHLPFWQMKNHNELIGNTTDKRGLNCFADPGNVYALYIANASLIPQLNLDTHNKSFHVQWYDPRNGGDLQNGSVQTVNGPGEVSLGSPPKDNNLDWVILIKAFVDECPEAGTPCDDGNPDTVNDVEDGNCNCAGEPVPQCPEAGTPCDDGNPDTVNDSIDENCDCSGEIPADASYSLWLEAECLDASEQWTIVEDAEASNGQFLLPPGRTSHNIPPTDEEDLIHVEFEVKEPGEYFVYFRALTSVDGGDSFWVRMDGDEWLKWNKINADPYTDDYQWAQTGDWNGGSQPDPVSFQLTAGVHIFQISWREPGVRLDKILITNHEGLPENEGPLADYYCRFSCQPADFPCPEPMLNIHKEVRRIRPALQPAEQSPNWSVDQMEESTSTGPLTLEVFPNPARERLNVTIGGGQQPRQDGTLYLSDVWGRVLRVLPIDTGFSGTLEIDLVDLPDGTYYLTLRSSSGLQTKAFLKVD